MKNPYAVNKLAFHPETLNTVRVKEQASPIFIQLMPSNVCPHKCDFCSYGHWKKGTTDPSKWVNHQIFDEYQMMPKEKMESLIRDMKVLGVKACEITGGGEPLTYPHLRSLFDGLKEAQIETALVTNGVLLDGFQAALLGRLPFVWARVSIDAGSSEQYEKLRHVPHSHWARAWGAVRLLAENKRHPEACVGVGFVMDQHNWGGIYEFVRIASNSGADNVRLSAAFTPDGLKRWKREEIEVAEEQARRAVKDFTRSDFTVINLISERIRNLEIAVTERGYNFCTQKEVACVIGPDCNIYSCCGLAFTERGLMGSFKNKSFEEAWRGEVREWQQQHQAAKHCSGIGCLYDARNAKALHLLANKLLHQPTPIPPHVNFI